MSRKIKEGQKLSEADLAYIQQREPWMKLPEGVKPKAERVATVSSEDGEETTADETIGQNTRTIEAEVAEEDDDSTESGQEDEDNEGDGYDSMSKDELKEECRSRDLPVGGKVEELVARLREDDEAALIEDDEE